MPVRRCRAPRRRLIDPRRRTHRRVARCRAVPVPHRSGAIVRSLAPDASTCRHRHLALPAPPGAIPGCWHAAAGREPDVPARGVRRRSCSRWRTQMPYQPLRAPRHGQFRGRGSAPCPLSLPCAVRAGSHAPGCCGVAAAPHSLRAARPARRPRAQTSCIAAPLDRLVMMRTVAVTLPGRNRQPRIVRVASSRRRTRCVGATREQTVLLVPRSTGHVAKC